MPQMRRRADVKPLLKWVWAYLFGCRHPSDKQSHVRTDVEGQYRRCLKCGARIAYDKIKFGTSQENTDEQRPPHQAVA